MQALKRKIIFYFHMFCLGLILTNCGPVFEKPKPWETVDEEQIKQDEDGIEKGDVSLEILEGELLLAMPYMINYDKNKYQYQRANSIDTWSGYSTVSQNNFTYGGPLPTTYSYPNPYLHGPRSEGTRLVAQTHHAYHNSDTLGVPEWRALAQIMYGYAMHEIADFHGAYTYTDTRAGKRTQPFTYESGEDIYFKIFADLEDAIQILKERQPTAEDLRRVEGDLGGMSRGQWQNWVKFANSIRLRMALNMVKVKPSEAQTIAESAVNDEIGVFQYNDLEFAFDDSNQPGGTHPVYSISNSWNDLRAGASIISIMKHFKSPLLPVWFNKNTKPILTADGDPTGYEADDDYFGIRQGVAMIDKSNESRGYGMYSRFQVRDYPRSVFKIEEVLALRAEGALRGWGMGGDAETFYHDMIRKSFDANGVSFEFDKYIELEDLPAIDHVDPYNYDNDIEGRVKIDVKWDNSDSDELKLEKIITQKYIANFGMGAEAWTTFRRTGYPRLFPVKINNWPGVDTELQIRRIPFEQNDNNALDFMTTLLPALGGSNDVSVRIWWDTPTEGRDENNQIVPNNF